MTPEESTNHIVFRLCLLSLLAIPVFSLAYLVYSVYLAYLLWSLVGLFRQVIWSVCPMRGILGMFEYMVLALFLSLSSKYIWPIRLIWYIVLYLLFIALVNFVYDYLGFFLDYLVYSVSLDYWPIFVRCLFGVCSSLCDSCKSLLIRSLWLI